MVLPHSIIIQLYTINTYASPVYDNGLMYCGQLLRDEEDAEGEVAEDAVKEEVI